MDAGMTATYRVQLHGGWDFAAATDIVPYLRALGVSHLYTSPCLQAMPGSTHGYDVADPTRVNEELGGEEGHRQLLDMLQTQGLGWVLDIVPNHMAIGHPANRWWWDVLKQGSTSRYARFFDIYGWHETPGSFEPIILPVLGDEREKVLAAGDLKVARESSEWVVCYYDHRFPIAPDSITPQLDQRDDFADALNSDRTLLEALLEKQHYRLVYWRRAARELNYRRFFDINTLIGVRVEDEEVFRTTHARVLDWIREGALSGLRVDHPDGLADPQDYFTRLRGIAGDLPIWAEKILEPGETMRDTWPIQGTTGYEFLNRVGGLFIDPDGKPVMTRLYQQFTGEQRSFPDIVTDSKRMVLRDILRADVRYLAHLLRRSRGRFESCETKSIEAALIEILTRFPVYRTYLQPIRDTLTPEDRRCIERALNDAKESLDTERSELVDHIGRELMASPEDGEPLVEFIRRFQQLSGPAMAKGVEDTTFYLYHRMAALNEVGGDPAHFGTSPRAFHEACFETQAHWPETLLTTSTHDTKRSEDVRARLAVLSEIPDRWEAAVTRWAASNARHKHRDLPDANVEYLLYQTLVGAWPIDIDRLSAYMEKAVREAKQHTSWVDTNQVYEDALHAFIRAILDDKEFVDDLKRFVDLILEPGRINALAQTLIKLTAPGVPDIYQGTELWDLSLVDPDNRRPVDYDLRRRLLAELDGLTTRQIRERMDEGLPKLHVIRQALSARRTLRYRLDNYTPLEAEGDYRDGILAFQRGEHLLTVVPRFTMKRRGAWGDTALTLPPGGWVNMLDEHKTCRDRVTMDTFLEEFPVALLIREEKIG